MAIVIFVGEDEETLRRGNGERVLTAVETMAVLKIAERAFKDLRDRGELVPYKEQLGNYHLFKVSDVEALRQRRLKRY